MTEWIATIHLVKLVIYSPGLLHSGFTLQAQLTGANIICIEYIYLFIYFLCVNLCFLFTHPSIQNQIQTASSLALVTPVRSFSYEELWIRSNCLGIHENSTGNR